MSSTRLNSSLPSTRLTIEGAQSSHAKSDRGCVSGLYEKALQHTKTVQPIFDNAAKSAAKIVADFTDNITATVNQRVNLARDALMRSVPQHSESQELQDRALLSSF